MRKPFLLFMGLFLLSLLYLPVLSQAQTNCSMTGIWYTSYPEPLDLVEDDNGNITGTAYLKGYWVGVGGVNVVSECGPSPVTGYRSGTTVMLDVANTNTPYPCQAHITFNLTNNCNYNAVATGPVSFSVKGPTATLTKQVPSATVDNFLNLPCEQ